MHQLQRSWFDPSIRRHNGIWGAADEAVLNIVRKKIKLKHKKDTVLYLNILILKRATDNLALTCVWGPFDASVVCTLYTACVNVYKESRGLYTSHPPPSQAAEEGGGGGVEGPQSSLALRTTYHHFLHIFWRKISEQKKWSKLHCVLKNSLFKRAYHSMTNSG